MLAAMTILIVLVLFLGRVVTESASVWSSGARRSEVNVWGRATIDFITRDLSALIADDVVRFQVRSDVDQAFGFDADRVHFIQLNQLAHSGEIELPGDTPRRTASAVIYYIRSMIDPLDGSWMDHRYRLTRNEWRSLDQVTAYEPNESPSIEEGAYWVLRNPQAAVSFDIAENIRTFEVFAYDYEFQGRFDFDNMGTLPGGSPWAWGPPLWVDIYMEVFAQSDAERAADLASVHGETAAITEDFVRRNVQRFAVRVFPHSATGFNRPGEYYPNYEPHRANFDWPAVNID